MSEQLALPIPALQWWTGPTGHLVRPPGCICDAGSYVVAVCHGHNRIDCPANPHNPNRRDA